MEEQEDRSVDRSIGPTVGRTADRWVGPTVARLLRRSVERSVGRSGRRSVSWSVGPSVGRSVGHRQSVGRSLGRSVGRSAPASRSVVGSVARSVARSLGRSAVGPTVFRTALRWHCNTRRHPLRRRKGKRMWRSKMTAGRPISLSTERIVVCCRRKLFPVCSDWELFLLQHAKRTRARRLDATSPGRGMPAQPRGSSPKQSRRNG